MALGSQTARFEWSTVTEAQLATQAIFAALKLALSSAQALHNFNLARCRVLTTDASNVAEAAILRQQDDEGRQQPVVYESSKAYCS